MVKIVDHLQKEKELTNAKVNKQTLQENTSLTQA